MAWPKPHPPPPSSWGASSIVSEATTENLLGGAEQLTSQQERMTEATTKLLAVLSEVRGGPWEAGPELTEMALTDWLGEQEDRVDELKERLDRKQRELVRLEEVEEEDRVPTIAPPNLNAAFRFSQVSFGSFGGGSFGGRTQEQADGPVRTSTPVEGGSNAHPDLGRFPRLKRRKAKLDADMSSLGDIVEGIVKEGCSKRKAELIEKDLVKVEESLDKVTELYDGAVEEMPWEEKREAMRDRDLSYKSSDNWIRGTRAKVRRHTQEAR